LQTCFRLILERKKPTGANTLKATVRPVTIRGKQQWCVRWRELGKRRRRFFKTKKLADIEAASLKSNHCPANQFWNELDQDDRRDIVEVLKDAQALGVKLADAWREWKHAPKVAANSPAIAMVIADLVQTKRNAGRDPGYVDSLEGVLNQFAEGRETVPIGEFTVRDIEAFLQKHRLVYRPTLRARLSTLFKFAMRRRHIPANPCAQLEAITVPKKSPAIFTPFQFGKAVLWLRRRRPRALGWFVLSTCCGLRPEEAEKTEPKRDINFDEGYIKVEAQTTKIRQRRVVYPRSEAMALLKVALEVAELPLDKQPRIRALTALRKPLHFERWPKDITRHTAASYWLAIEPDAARVAEMLGHSEKTLKRDYKALVTQVGARMFWSAVKKLVEKL
jgi:site-specific recombinase XerC